MLIAKLCGLVSTQMSRTFTPVAPQPSSSAESTTSIAPTGTKSKNLEVSYSRSRLHRLRSLDAVSLMRRIYSAALYRLHFRVLDPIAYAGEPESVKRTTRLCDVTITSRHRDGGVEYTPTPHLIVRWIRHTLPSDVSNWTFIDIGAGRGRVLASAARSPYRMVLGVEFAHELQQDAEVYLKSLPRRHIRAGDVTVIRADATTFSIPDGPCIFYLFNPFSGEVLRRFLDHVIASHKADPRPMRIVYFNPEHGELLDASDHIRRSPLRLLTRAKFALLSPHQLALYEITEGSCR